MAIWMEIRCDAQKSPKSYYDKCYSYDNSGPHGMAGDNQTSVIQTLRDMNDQAKRDGWKRIDGGWVCPHCISK